MNRSNEQLLIDVLFEYVVRMQGGDFKFENRDVAAENVASNLRHLGFDTEPVGLSWGVIKKITR